MTTTSSANDFPGPKGNALKVPAPAVKGWPDEITDAQAVDRAIDLACLHLMPFQRESIGRAVLAALSLRGWRPPEAAASAAQTERPAQSGVASLAPEDQGVLWAFACRPEDCEDVLPDGGSPTRERAEMQRARLIERGWTCGPIVAMPLPAVRQAPVPPPTTNGSTP